MMRAGLVLCLVVLSGCRLTQLVYNNAEWLLLREADKTICPGSPQRSALRQALRDFLRWHRRSELPAYAALLRRVARGLEQPVTHELVRATTLEVEQAWSRAARRAARPLVELGLSLGKREASCLTASLARGRRDSDAELAASPEAYAARERRKAAERIEPWVGELSAAQRELLARSLPARADAAAAARARYLKGLRLAVAIASPDAARKRRWLQAWVSDPYALYSAEERALVKRFGARNRDRLLALAQTLSTAQRSRLARKLGEYASDFEALARQ
jgi:hypothetical protein